MSVGLHIFTEQIYNIYGGERRATRKQQNKTNTMWLVVGQHQRIIAVVGGNNGEKARCV
jgi:hypothetical protein